MTAKFALRSGVSFVVGRGCSEFWSWQCRLHITKILLYYCAALNSICLTTSDFCYIAVQC